jgi:hypothetical protein
MPKKLALLAAVWAAALTLPVVTDASETTVCQLAAKPASFNNQNVTLQGSVAALRETTSQARNDYTTFKLQDQGGSCAVTIFTWGHPALSNNDQVRVDGVFEIEHRQGKYTFYNEVQATKISPLPR